MYDADQYLNFFGLFHDPFPVAPDNRHFFISRYTDQVVANICRAIFERKGFMLLVGETGLGKTTLSRRIINILDKNGVETALILQSFYQETDLLKEINRDFGIHISAGDSLSVLMGRLTDFLLKKNGENVNCAIVIDDAQNLSFKSLELIRMISNLEADRKKLVQILLTGQSELLDKLNSHALRQLKSRVAILQQPMPLEKFELVKYLDFKLKTAGNTGKITIKKSAVSKLYRITSGNLRMVNVIMSGAMVMAFEKQSFVIERRLIDEAHDNLEFKPHKSGKTIGFYFAVVFLIVVLVAVGFAVNNILYLRADGKKIFKPSTILENSDDFTVTKKIPVRHGISR